jgi:hypothetical protein
MSELRARYEVDDRAAAEALSRWLAGGRGPGVGGRGGTQRAGPGRPAPAAGLVSLAPIFPTESGAPLSACVAPRLAVGCPARSRPGEGYRGTNAGASTDDRRCPHETPAAGAAGAAGGDDPAPARCLPDPTSPTRHCRVHCTPVHAWAPVRGRAGGPAQLTAAGARFGHRARRRIGRRFGAPAHRASGAERSGWRGDQNRAGGPGRRDQPDGGGLGSSGSACQGRGHAADSGPSAPTSSRSFPARAPAPPQMATTLVTNEATVRSARACGQRRASDGGRNAA